MQEERNVIKLSNQHSLFPSNELQTQDAPQKKYRRQSIHMSPGCSDDHLVRWNKSFDQESIVYKAVDGRLHSAVEQLPNVAAQSGLLEVMQAPYQREEADEKFGDVLFFWSA
jgi:hypothetical protein